jgi:diazepam-binding inhibitor (GABA receptor modulating acyl-CoA-binding protein)
MSAPQSDAFKKAVVDSKKLTSKPSNEDLLELYGELAPSFLTAECEANRRDVALYKVGTGEDFSSASKPGMFDLKVRSGLHSP